MQITLTTNRTNNFWWITAKANPLNHNSHNKRWNFSREGEENWYLLGYSFVQTIGRFHCPSLVVNWWKNGKDYEGPNWVDHAMDRSC